MLTFSTGTDTPGQGILPRDHGHLLYKKSRVRPRLVDLSRIPSGTFFREVHPASEMTGQNGQNGRFCDITKRPGFLE